MLITRGVDEGQPCFAVATAGARYYYQIEAGGFSSICDKDGVDWINFHPGEELVPGGAANVFRGLPNLVHPDGIGHPGFAECTSSFTMDKTTIEIQTASNDGLWKWDVRFREEFAILSVSEAPDDRKYWFLYEGTVGGVFDPVNTYWGFPDRREYGSKGDRERLASAHPFPGENWSYFGHKGSPRVFYCARLSDAIDPGVLYFMGSDSLGFGAADGMIVFGYGRDTGVTKLLRGAERFIFGFVESTDHREIDERIAAGIAEAQNGTYASKK